MTRDEVARFMYENPEISITHTSFHSGYYIYQARDGIVYDSSGMIFHEWYSNDILTVPMQYGWSVLFRYSDCKLLSETNSGREYLYNSVCRGCQNFRCGSTYVH